MRAEQCFKMVSQLFGHLYLEIKILEKYDLGILGVVWDFGIGTLPKPSVCCRGCPQISVIPEKHLPSIFLVF